MRSLFLLVFVALLGLTACDSDSRVEATPTPSATDRLAILDWHLAFSSDSSTALLRCNVTNPDDSVQTLLEPLPVRAWATLLTPQLLGEASDILLASNPLVAERLENQLSYQHYVVVLLQVNFVTRRDRFRLHEMSPTLYPDEYYSDDEIHFFLPTSGDGSALTLTVGDHVLGPPPDFALLDIRQGEYYAIPFLLEDVLLEALSEAGTVEFAFVLALIPPFQNRFCSTSNNTAYRLYLPTTSSEDEQATSIYGDALLNGEQDILQLRFELLTRILPRVFEADYRLTPLPATDAPVPPSETPISP